MYVFHQEYSKYFYFRSTWVQHLVSFKLIGSTMDFTLKICIGISIGEGKSVDAYKYDMHIADQWTC